MDNLPTSFGSSSSFKFKSRRCRPNIKPENIEKLFNKKFSFPNDSCWSFPLSALMFQQGMWEISELQVLKEKLNGVKSKLNDYDLIDWHKHTSSTNIAGDIVWKLKNEFIIEFVTQAWCKFYEIAMTFSLIPAKCVESQFLNSLHLCEAPGAFICSLNHYLRCFHTDIKWNWRASTFNPYYEGNLLSSMINDDRIIFNTLSNWVFGIDKTGDLMDLQNVEHLMKEIAPLGEISLITADGSIDCHNTPAEQESAVSHLHLYETFTALNILASGGSFILKIFTTFEAPTVCLLYFLNCAFGQVHLFKPVTSKEGNSEVYVVCLKYKGKLFLDPWLKKIRNVLELQQLDKVMFPLESIAPSFINQLLMCTEFFMGFQIDAVEKNIKLYCDPSQVFNTKQIRYLTAKKFIELYQVSSLIDQSKMVIGNKKLKRSQAFNLDGGTFSDQLLKKCLHWKEKVQCIYSFLLEMNVLWKYDGNIKWFRFTSSAAKLKEITGRPVNIVHSSKFCSKSLLIIWQNFREVLTDLPNFNEYGSQISKNLPKTVFSENDLSSYSKCKYLDLGFYYENIVFCSENDNFEKKCFINIISTVCDLLLGDNLVLQNYPMLTQFNVGVVYLLSSLFLKVGFMKPEGGATGIIFVGFQGEMNDTLTFLKEMKETCIDSASSNRQNSILSLVSIDVLCGFEHEFSNAENVLTKGNKCIKKDEIISIQTPAFHCSVTEINNIFLKDTISNIAEKLMR